MFQSISTSIVWLEASPYVFLPPLDHGFNNHKIESVQWMMSAEAIRGRKAPPRAPLSITPTTIIQLGSFQVSSLILDGMTNHKAE